MYIRIVLLLSCLCFTKAFGQVYDYFVLTEELDGAYCITSSDEVLHIRFTEEYNVPLDENLDYLIYDQLNNPVLGTLPVIGIKTGVNDIDLPLTSLNLCNGKFYRLEVKNSKNEVFYALFQANDGTATTCTP